MTAQEVAAMKPSTTPPATPRANGNRDPEIVTEPIKLSEFRNNGRSVTIVWLGQEIKFFYKPASMDAEHYEQIMKEDDKQTMSEWSIEYALRIFDAIPSICEDDGSPLAITRENMRKLPQNMLSMMISAISQDLAPKAPTASNLNGSSPPAEPKA